MTDKQEDKTITREKKIHSIKKKRTAKIVSKRGPQTMDGLLLWI